MSSGIVWRAGQSPADLAAKIKAWGERFLAAIHAVGALVAAEALAFAQAHEHWRDRSGDARQMLNAVALDLGATAVAIVLYHGAPEGKWLEIAHQSKYAVIIPTLPYMYSRVAAAIQAAFGG